MVNNENTTINPKNNAFDAFNDHRWFQYAVTVASNHKNFGKKFSNNIKIKPFINQYNLKEINYTSHKKDWKKFESNNKLINN